MPDIRRTREEFPCGCVVEYDWDAELPQESRRYKITTVFRTSVNHEGKLQIGQDPFKVLV